jgi:superfamily II DNA or RNA helicase
MTKEELQNIALDLSKSYDKLVLSFATGSGKSVAALKIIKHFGGRWYIIVAETTHIKNWHDEIVKHGYEDLLMYIDIFCYDSLHKYEFSQVEGMIWDEGHHAQAPTYIPKLQSIKTNHIIVLTATLPPETKSYLNYIFGNFYEYKYPLSQAIKDGILPEPKIFLVGIDLPEKETFHIVTKGYKDKRTKLTCNFGEQYKLLSSYNHLELKIRCTERERYQLLENEVDYARDYYLTKYDEISDRYSSEKLSKIEKLDTREKLLKEKERQLKIIEYFKTQWLSLGSKRKRYMADIKTLAAKTVLDKIKDYKLLCFTGTIEQANVLAFSPDMIINSYKNKLENSKIITNFDKGIIRALFPTGMLTEGVNLNGIEAALIIQLDNQTKSLIQRLGRVLRSESPICYILYLKDTQDEKYLNTAFKGFNKDYLYYTNINEI